MHECRMVDQLIRKIEEVAALSQAGVVRAVSVRLGPLAEMSPDHFQKHFAYAARGTLVENVTLAVHLSDHIDDPLGRDALLESVTMEE